MTATCASPHPTHPWTYGLISMHHLESCLELHWIRRAGECERDCLMYFTRFTVRGQQPVSIHGSETWFHNDAGG